jgi:hypothetical protein
MARVTVPGIKNSNGMKGFQPLVDGDYMVQCTAVTISPPKNNAPADVWCFVFNILEGPPQGNGKIAKGLPYKEWITILKDIHPSYKAEWDDPDSGKCQFSVDQLKSLCIAMGVAPKGDTLEPSAFNGQKCRVHLSIQKDKDNPDTLRQRSNNWRSE